MHVHVHVCTLYILVSSPGPSHKTCTCTCTCKCIQHVHAFTPYISLVSRPFPQYRTGCGEKLTSTHGDTGCVGKVGPIKDSLPTAPVLKAGHPGSCFLVLPFGMLCLLCFMCT